MSCPPRTSHASETLADNVCLQQGVSRRHIIAEAEASLKRLQTDHIDLDQIHRPHPEVAIDETLRALDDLVRAGKVRYVGTTTFAAWQIVEALWASEKHHLNRFVSEQPPYNLLNRRIERELLPVAQTYSLAVLPCNPIGGGILSGKYQRGQPIPTDSRYADPSPVQVKRFTKQAYDVIEPLTTLAAEKKVPLSQLALAWVVQQPGITSAIIGSRTLEQLEDAIKALDVTLTPDDLKRIDEIIPQAPTSRLSTKPTTPPPCTAGRPRSHRLTSRKAAHTPET